MVAVAEDVAYGTLDLASDEWPFVTGSEVVIGGGSTAQREGNCQGHFGGDSWRTLS